MGLDTTKLGTGKLYSLRKDMVLPSLLGTHFLTADGSEVSKADYPQLYNIFGNSYGKAKRDENFVLPKLTKGLVLNPPVLISGDSNGNVNKVYAENWTNGSTAMTRVNQKIEGRNSIVSKMKYEIRIVRASPDGNFLYCGTDRGLVHKIDAITMTQIIDGIFEGHNDKVYALALSSDGNTLYSGGHDGKVYKIDTQTMTKVDEFDASNEIWTLLLSPDDTILYVGGKTGFLSKIKTSDMTFAKDPIDSTIDLKFESNSGYTFSLAISTDGSILYSGDQDGKVHKINSSNMTQEGVFHSASEVWALALDDNGEFLYGAGFNYELFKIKTSDMSAAKDSDKKDIRFQGFFPFSTENDNLNTHTLALSKDGLFLYSGGNDGIVYKINTTDMTRVDFFEVYYIWSLALFQDANNEYLYSTVLDGKVFKIDTTTMSQYSDENTDGLFEVAGKAEFRAFAISFKGDFFYSGTNDGSIFKVFNNNMLVDMTFIGHGTSEIGSIVISHDDAHLFSCDFDGNVFKIDTETMDFAKDPNDSTKNLTFDSHLTPVLSLALSFDGNYLYSGAVSGIIYKIDTIKMTQAKEEDGVTPIPPFDDQTQVFSLVTSLDGQYLFKGAHDGRVVKISTTTMTGAQDEGGNGILAFTGHSSTVIIRALAISKKDNGAYLYSAGSDGKIFKIDAKTMTQATEIDGSTLIAPFEGHGSSEIFKLALSEEEGEEYLYSGGADGKVFKINTNDMTQVGVFDGHGEFDVRALVYSKALFSDYQRFPLIYVH